MSTTAGTRTQRTEHPALTEVRLRRTRRAEADLALIRSVVEWASEHEVAANSLEAANVGPFGESDLALAGPGAPHVGEFALYELATVLGRTINSTKAYVGDILEVRYRLPGLWTRVADDGLAPWRAFRIAEHTRDLPMAGARYVDTALAPFATSLTSAQLDRTLTHALARYAPEEAKRRAEAAAERRRVDIDLSHHQDGRVAGLAALEGTVRVEATLDAADALDLEHAVRGVADQLKRLGSEASRDVRRAQALGEIARTQLSLDLTPTTPTAQTGQATPAIPAAPRSPGAPAGPGGAGQTGRWITLHVHLHPDSDVADLDTPGLRGSAWVDQVRQWCQAAGTRVTVTPVIDLAADLTTKAYTPSPGLRRQVQLRDCHCVAPYCTRPARVCDLDHLVPHAEGGTTASGNLAPLCRRHHRAKTHGGWHYLTTAPGTYAWTTPTGLRFTVDPTGTHPDPPD